MRHLALILLLGCFSSQLLAHPHVWIDLKVTPKLNDQGQVVALQQAWRFDPFYSLLLIEELEKGGPAEELEERIDQLALEVVRNLKNFDFFTRLRMNGQRQQFAEVEEYNLMQVGRRMEFSFILPLSQPLDLKANRLRYQVYDPSYYIEILHASSEGPSKEGLPEGCKVTVEAPNPSSDLIEKALALDEDEVPEDPQLGEHFTETVYVECP